MERQAKLWDTSGDKPGHTRDEASHTLYTASHTLTQAASWQELAHPEGGCADKVTSIIKSAAPTAATEHVRVYFKEESSLVAPNCMYRKKVSAHFHLRTVVFFHIGFARALLFLLK